MSKEIFFMLFSVVFISMIWYILRRKTRNLSDNASSNNLQNIYSANKNLNIKLLSPKERLELSWEPIRKLAEYISNMFNDSDKIKMVEVGRKLLKYKMKYIHVIDYAIPQNNRTNTREPETGQNIDKTSISR